MKSSSTASLNSSQSSTAINKPYASEEARIKSFDNERLLIGVGKLAANGLYCVPRHDATMTAAASSKDKIGEHRS